MLILLILICFIPAFLIAAYLYMKQAKFGALPSGERLIRVQRSPHYKDGAFHNLVEKPELAEGYSVPKIIWEALVKKYPETAPAVALPAVKINLKELPADKNVIVWFGHSSFFLQLDGVKFIVDPVFSGNASPLPGGVKAFKGSDVYTVDDLPEIDYFLLSHDHYDHLDYKTVRALQSEVKFVICGLGAGAHLERWGYSAGQILEKDWGDVTAIKPGFNIYAESTHHFSGRGIKRGQSLWLSFYIQSPSLNIYYSGDGGYSDRFKTIAAKYPPIDWAIMECGQYNTAWPHVHAFPAEVALAATELKSKNMLPVHHSKFKLSKHPWYEPLADITRYSEGKNYRLVTPMIGEAVDLDSKSQLFSQWWKNVN